jgi:glycosyltransferase involved in cell wall biosynthesis
MPATDRLSVVVPVYRNAATVESLHDQLVEHVQPYEILFVVDGSPDDSLSAVLALQQRSRMVKVVSLVENSGQSWAILVGLRHAAGELIVTMDADLQDPPSAIPALLDALQPDFDVVFAGRRGTYESASRLATSKLFKRSLARMSRGRLPADAGLFMVMRRSVAEYLLGCRDIDPYIISMLGRGRWRLRSIPVARKAAGDGRSSYTFLGRLAVARRALSGMLRPSKDDAHSIRTRIETDHHSRYDLYPGNRSSQ